VRICHFPQQTRLRFCPLSKRLHMNNRGR
jgi:hypothetical protein